MGKGSPRCVDQREIRLKVYMYLKELDERFREDPSGYVFPDPYALLLWMWTFQLFHDVYVREPGKAWMKFFYCGEAKDYGSTGFLPRIKRLDVSHSQRDSTVPASLLELIKQYLNANQSWKAGITDESLIHFLIETMSSSQALAVAQHYDYPTPLLDVTIHPEIALYFATRSYFVINQRLSQLNLRGSHHLAFFTKTKAMVLKLFSMTRFTCRTN